MLPPVATQRRLSSWLCWHRARRDRNGSVAVIGAVVAPILVLAMGLGIDVSYWMTARLQLQRMADLAAMAGAAKYASQTDTASALTTAANVAELNGFPAASRITATPSTGTNTISESYNPWSGLFTSNSNAQLVTVALQRQVPRFFSAAVLSSEPTISVTAAAEVVPRPGVGQACVLALQGTVTSATDISANGNVDITLNGCDLRSNASMVLNGNVTLAVPDLIASGAVTMNGNISEPCAQGQVCDTVLTQQPQVPDPFSGTYGSLLTSIPTGAALNIVSQPSGSTASPPAGTAYQSPSGDMVLSPPAPGTAYQDLNFNTSGTVTLNPGVYYVSGSVTFNGNENIVGQGVTIISGGGITINGDSTINLTAPLPAAAGASPNPTAGLLFGSAEGVTINGDSTQTLAGAIYAPNGTVTVNGNSSTGTPGAGTPACLDIVANSVTFNGDSTLTNSGCAGMGVPAVSDQPGIARLIQ